MYRLILTVPVLLAAFVMFTPGSASAQTRFARPVIDGARLDWCREWAANCGQPAADAFCRRKGFPRSTGFRIEPNIGASAPTRIIGTGQVCGDSGCDGFRYVDCARRADGRRFDRPQIRGARLDWCREWGVNCGKPAADAFCRARGFGEASRFQIAENIGARTPTRIITSGAICNNASCDGFRFIACRVAGGGGGGDGAARPHERNFARPKIRGSRLDWCREWGVNCGKPAADAFCRARGFGEASRFQIAENIGARTPTRIITSGAICNNASCDGFRFIRCTGRDSAGGSGGDGGDGAARPRERRFDRPKIRGTRLDWCREWGANCGKPAADAFCRAKGYARAARFRIAENIGARRPTRIISTGQICRNPGCDGFRDIVCRR